MAAHVQILLEYQRLAVGNYNRAIRLGPQPHSCRVSCQSATRWRSPPSPRD